ncbi:unnamed protein product [Cyprideis torosa]|uniref:Uncharacterized protein n=1 Tax=Cyprideis torosa TaxID=163714 RepID=A0A7R8ZR00_9CRUS|nr:unnamed protein product [Cyprideis torosa]CAG0902556.1 unnamed protein product [Cyprideis torosa]
MLHYTLVVIYLNQRFSWNPQAEMNFMKPVLVHPSFVDDKPYQLSTSLRRRLLNFQCPVPPTPSDAREVRVLWRMVNIDDARCIEDKSAVNTQAPIAEEIDLASDGGEDAVLSEEALSVEAAADLRFEEKLRCCLLRPSTADDSELRRLLSGGTFDPSVILRSLRRIFLTDSSAVTSDDVPASSKADDASLLRLLSCLAAAPAAATVPVLTEMVLMEIAMEYVQSRYNATGLPRTLLSFLHPFLCDRPGILLAEIKKSDEKICSALVQLIKATIIDIHPRKMPSFVRELIDAWNSCAIRRESQWPLLLSILSPSSLLTKVRHQHQADNSIPLTATEEKHIRSDLQHVLVSLALSLSAEKDLISNSAQDLSTFSKFVLNIVTCIAQNHEKEIDLTFEIPALQSILLALPRGPLTRVIEKKIQAL